MEERKEKRAGEGKEARMKGDRESGFLSQQDAAALAVVGTMADFLPPGVWLNSSWLGGNTTCSLQEQVSGAQILLIKGCARFTITRSYLKMPSPGPAQALLSLNCFAEQFPLNGDSGSKHNVARLGKQKLIKF